MDEYSELWKKCGGTLVNASHYKYCPEDDTYVDKSDKHEWSRGEDVRRLRELAKEKT